MAPKAPKPKEIISRLLDIIRWISDRNRCGDQLLVSLFDITNIYINVLYKDIKTGSAHVTLLDITNLYKQDAVSMTRLQCICGIGFAISI